MIRGAAATISGVFQREGATSTGGEHGPGPRQPASAGERSRSRERPLFEEEDSEQEEEFNPEKAQEQLFLQGKKTRKEIKVRFQTVGKELQNVKKDVKAVSDRQDSMERTVTALAQQVQELQTKGAGSSSGASVASARNANAYAVPARSMREQWNPTYVQLSGWSKGGGHIKNRGSELMQENEATKVLQFVTNNSKIAKDHIDEEMTIIENSHKPFGFARIRIVFKPGTPGKILWDFRNEISQMTGSAQFKEITTKEVRPSVEPSPWKRPHNAAAGIAYGVWQSISTVPIKCELGPPFTFVWCCPDAADPSKNFVIASFGDKSRQWKVDEGQVQLADPTVDAAILLERLNTF